MEKIVNTCTRTHAHTHTRFVWSKYRWFTYALDREAVLFRSVFIQLISDVNIERGNTPHSSMRESRSCLPSLLTNKSPLCEFIFRILASINRPIGVESLFQQKAVSVMEQRRQRRKKKVLLVISASIWENFYKVRWLTLLELVFLNHFTVWEHLFFSFVLLGLVLTATVNQDTPENGIWNLNQKYFCTLPEFS